MQTASSYAQVGNKSAVEYLPIIDLNPNSPTCIYSTLRFIIDLSKQLNVDYTPCVTFDQPLYLKAIGIIRTERLPIVCRLGGFYVLMSFLGSLVNLMKGSGLEELFEEVYAPNTIPMMMAGKQTA